MAEKNWYHVRLSFETKKGNLGTHDMNIQSHTIISAGEEASRALLKKRPWLARIKSVTTHPYEKGYVPS